MNECKKPEGVAKRTKSRNGCRECKAKRLKCDETKPECLQCTRRGKQCPGYVKDFKFSAKHERLHSYGGQPKRNRKASTSTTTAPPRRDSALTGTAQHCHGLPAYPIDQVLNFAAPVQLPSLKSPAVISAPDKNPHADAPSPGPSTHASSSPRSGYLSWSEVLSPAPTAQDDQEGETTPASPDVPTTEDVAMGTKVEEAPVSPVSLPRSPNQQLVKASSKLLHNPIDLPSTLIEYWFSHVSAMWSAYDSPQNPNRQLALSNHANSESVYYALQSMSAAHRVDSLPHLKPILTSSLANAMAAIRRELDAHYDIMPRVRPELPVDLLLAMFAMASSLCWTDTSQLGEQLVVGARALLDLYGMAGNSMSEEDRKHLLHFKHALSYLEMLHNFVNPEAGAEVKALRRRRSSSESAMDLDQVPRPSHAFPQDTKLDEYGLHPWTGVSGEVQEKFGVAMALCREHLRSERRERQHINEDEAEKSNLELAIELAQDLRAITFNFERDATSGEDVETGDLRTPLAHLIDTAEAYRLAALLQLHLTFRELDVCEALAMLSSPALSNTAIPLPRDQALVVLTMELVHILERIPADSGTRCIQPVLYISAATGLKFDTPVNAGSAVTEGTLEVAKARQFIIDRLASLQRSLPPRPISVALRLIKAIWEEYDYGGQRHWIDVMRENPGLQTLFG